MRAAESPPVARLCRRRVVWGRIGGRRVPASAPSASAPSAAALLRRCATTCRAPTCAAPTAAEAYTVKTGDGQSFQM